MCLPCRWFHGALWILMATLPLQGCRTGPPRIDPPVFEDDFGEPDSEEITVESVHGSEMIRQRAQVEFKFGGVFPFDLVSPDADTRTDSALGLGGKFAFEASKNLFLGLAVDYSSHDVEDVVLGGNRQIDNIRSYDRTNFLATVDYDYPLWDATDALILRFGAGAGLNWENFESRSATRQFEDFFGFVFRPSVGLRYPVTDFMLLFTELSYDFVPARSLETTETERVSGERPIFSAGAVWAGVAFEWD